jgi:hypothetical protein
VSKPFVTLAVLASVAVCGCGSSSSGTIAKTPCEELSSSAEISVQTCKQRAKQAASEHLAGSVAESEATIKRAEEPTESAHEAAEKQHATPEGKARAKEAEEENEAASEGERLKSEGKVP